MLSLLTNQPSLAANRVLTQVQSAVQTTIQRLSSGLRVSHASDDAAGLAIAERMEARGRSLRASVRGVNDLISLVQVADAALGSIGGNLQRIRELAVQAANGTLNTLDRQALDQESRTLISASREIQDSASFNGQKLLDGSLRLQEGMPGFDAGATLHLQGVFLPKTTDALFRMAQMAQASATITPSGALLAGALLINGKAVPASVAGGQAGQTSDSAWAIAQAITGAGVDGLTAVADPNIITGISTPPPGGGILVAGQITINGVSIGAGNYVSAINARTAQTGVSASVAGGALILTAADGRNIDVSGTAAFGLADQNKVGTLTVTGALAEGSKANLTLTGSNPAAAGFAGGTVAGVDTGGLVAVPLDEDAGFDLTPSLETVDGANSTILLMDRKLDKLLALRPKLGALQNALELRSAFLASADEANAAARSRIVDADYAQETAALVRNTILQSAGLAMIAQANASTSRLVALLIRSR